MRSLTAGLVLFLAVAACNGFFAAAAPDGWDDDRIHAAVNDDRVRATLEQELVEVLGSDAGFAEKRSACRRLRRVGSGNAVPVLADLLYDAKLTHMARFALQQMPGKAAGDALRTAAGKLKGEPLIGVLDSLGERGEPDSVPVLAKHARDGDAAIAAAALRALGKVGGTAALDALGKVEVPRGKAMRHAWFDARIDCACGLMDEGQREAAHLVFLGLRSIGPPSNAVPAVVRGLLLTGEDGRIELLGETLAAADPAVRATAVRYIAAHASEDELKAMTRALDDLAVPGRTGLLFALAERGYGRARKPALELVDSKSEDVRVAAVRALAELGTDDDIGVLLDAACEDSARLRKAALISLSRLRGDDVDDEMISLLRKSDRRRRILLIKLLADRGAVRAVKTLRKLAEKDEGEVRTESVKALGRLVSPEDMDQIVDLVLSAGEESDLRAASGALKKVCMRVEPKRRAELTGPVLAGLKKATGAARNELLLFLPMLGNAAALEAVRSGLADKDAETRQAALRALSSWPNGAAAADLLRLAGSAGSEKDRAVAFRGYTRLIDREGDAAVRLKMCGKAAELATRRNDKKMLLSSIGRIGHIEALRIARRYLSDESVREEACSAAIRVARHLSSSRHKEVQKVMKEVMAKTKNRRHRKQADAILKSP